MTYRYAKCSGQGLRFDVFDSENKRICITHIEDNAKLIIRALEAEARKQAAISSVFGKSPLREEVERECCGTFFRTPHRSTCPKYRGKK